MAQASLFDIRNVRIAQAQKTAAVDRVEAHYAAWCDLAEAAVMQVIGDGRCEFTTDDVWALLPPMAVEPRAMGAVMRRLVKAGHIRSTGRWAQSERTACHRRPVRVWEAVR